MSGIGVLDGMYCPMFSTAALEIRYQHSDIIYTLMLTAAAFGYLVGPPAIGKISEASILNYTDKVLGYTIVTGLSRTELLRNISQIRKQYVAYKALKLLLT